MTDRRLLKLNFKTFTSAIADLALPRVCVVCGQGLMPGERHICLECLADLPLTRLAGMSRNPMADIYNALIENQSADTATRIPYQYATALFYYCSDSPYRKITQALKYHRDFGAGRMFARMLGEQIRDSGLYADVDLVVPVPLHWTRRMKRGYNQSDVIAREVAGVLGVRVDTRALKRARRTGSQVRLAGEARTGNVSGAFRVNHKDSFAGSRHVLIVDDVFTTGATLSACYDALRQQFPPEKRISIATLGFVQNG